MEENIQNQMENHQHQCHCNDDPECNCEDHECNDPNCKCNQDKESNVEYEEIEECKDPNCHCHDHECDDPKCHCHDYYEDDEDDEDEDEFIERDMDAEELAGHADDKVDALIEILIKKGVFTEEEFTKEYEELFEDVPDEENPAVNQSTPHHPM